MRANLNDYFYKMLVLILALFVLSGFAFADGPAGKVEFATAGVMIKSIDGTTKPATKSVIVSSGDSIDTGAGRIQIRMADGAFFSLQPNTQFRLDEYAQNKAEPAKERSFVTLIKGGLRSVTGLIGKNNRKNYKLSSPTATIGIRGTEYSVISNEKGDTFSVASGGISVCNAGGCQDVGPGQTAFAPNQNTRPVLTNSAQVGGANNDALGTKPDLGGERVISTDVIDVPTPHAMPSEPTSPPPSYTPPPSTAPPSNYY